MTGRGKMVVLAVQQGSIFNNISPLDHRYYDSNRELFDTLREYISEEAMIKYCARVEGALLKTHLHFRRQRVADSEIDEVSGRLDPAEVYREEKRTEHHMQALVNVLKAKMPEKIRHLVHLGATSVDILDTANAWRMRDVTRAVLLPRLIVLAQELLRLSEEHAGTPQVGRTHGRYAVPITLGHSFAEYVSRLGKSILEIEGRAGDLRGKLAGAVGSYNAMSILYKDPRDVERHFLNLLGLEPSDHSTQIVEPEYQLRLMLELNTAFGIIANLADDLRHLQRSGVDELREGFSSEQVGSSTMPHKRNPWNCEHVKSLWKAFAPRIMTMYMDQISEHQRDMTNSASGRFVPEYIAGFMEAVTRMSKILRNLVVDRESLARNLRDAGSSLLAEPVYILLAGEDEPAAHEIVRRITLRAEEENVSFYDALRADEMLWNKLTGHLRAAGLAEDFLTDPASYRGRGQSRASELSSHWRAEMLKLHERLGAGASPGAGASAPRE